MARARNIKPSFFMNEKLAECDPLARLLFAGLWTIADRAGRMEDRPKKIKAELLPYDDADADGLLQQLALHGFIVRYAAGEHHYIQVLNFVKHQNPHVKEAESTIPAPDSHGASTVQNVPLPLNPIPITDPPIPLPPSVKRKPVRKPASDYTPEFEGFWGDYPRRDGSKSEAFKSYQAAIEGGTDHGRISEGVRKLSEYVSRNAIGQKYIPHASTWLNQRRWESEYRDERPYSDGKPGQTSEKQLAISAYAAIIERRNADADKGVQGQPEPAHDAAGTMLPDAKGLW